MAIENLTLDPTQGSGNGTVKVTVPENIGEARSAKLLFKSAGGVTREVQVNQQTGNPLHFIYNSDSLSFYQGTVMPSGSVRNAMFAIDGAFDIDINGTVIKDIDDDRTFGSEYLNPTGNEVKIYPHEGTTINHLFSNVTSTQSSANETQYISEILSWGDAEFGEVSYMFARYSSSSECQITSFPKLSEGFKNVTDFSYMFYNCHSLISIPSGMFDSCSKVTYFSYMFYNCHSLTSIPSGLFDSCSKVTTFANTFYRCTGITSIPSGMFDSCTAVTTFLNTFYGCTGITSIPSGLFNSCTAVTTFQSTFDRCTGITSIPSGLFNSCTAVTTFQSTFYRCTGITSIPSGLFDSCSKVTTFANTFYGCTGITSIPENLFAKCTKVTTFQSTFDSGSSSVNNLTGESAYDRVDISGVETVIHLYERSSYSSLYTAPTSTSNCYRYQTKLDDYSSIPDDWK